MWKLLELLRDRFGSEETAQEAPEGDSTAEFYRCNECEKSFMGDDIEVCPECGGDVNGPSAEK